MIENTIEKRLICAQLLNSLLKQNSILKIKNPKADKEISAEIDAFVRSQMQNLLLKVMGEQTNEQFDNEEVQILKAMVSKIKNNVNGAK